MNAVIRFHKGLLRLPLWVQLFMLALVAVNMVTPLFMIRRIEAQIVLGTFLASFTLMMILTRLVGFTRLLGLAHIFWIPLLLYVGSRLEVYAADEAIGVWLRLLIGLNAVALVLDAIDVIRYIRGDRDEMDRRSIEGNVTLSRAEKEP